MVHSFDVILKDVDQINVYVSCEDGIAYEIADRFTFSVPGAQFSPAYRARAWDGKIRLFNMRTRMIYRGLAQEIIKFCKDRGLTVLYDRESPEPFDHAKAQEFIKTLNLPIEPRDYQVNAFVTAINDRRAMIISPTATGKSLIMYMIVRYLLSIKHVPGILIVPNVSLVLQLYGDFKDYSVNNGFDVDKYVQMIYEGQSKDITKPLAITTWQSIYTQKKSFFHKFKFIMGDEAHLFKAKSLIHIMTSLTSASYRIGTTGTLDGTKTNEMVLIGLFGSKKVVTTSSEQIQKGNLAKLKINALLLRHTPENCQAQRTSKYQEEIAYLIASEARNKFIRNLALSLPGNTLILYQYVEKHGSILEKMIREKAGDRKVFYIHGGVKGDIRDEVRSIVEKEKDAIIIASFGTFSTGINIRNLHNLIFASPSKARVKILQSIGRILRLGSDKFESTLYDIADDLRYKKKENYTLKHFAERMRIYQQEGFAFKLHKIDLKG